MTQTLAISEKTTLKYLREHFGMQRTDDPDFFQEWRSSQTLAPGEITALERIRTRYFHQLDEGMMLGNGVMILLELL
jgi:hypothetical protein